MGQPYTLEPSFFLVYLGQAGKESSKVQRAVETGVGRLGQKFSTTTCSSVNPIVEFKDLMKIKNVKYRVLSELKIFGEFICS